MTVTAEKPLWSPATSSAEVGPVAAASTAPAQPAAPTLTRGPASITVHWAAPDDGGRPITGYSVTLRPRRSDHPVIVKEVSGAGVRAQPPVIGVVPVVTPPKGTGKIKFECVASVSRPFGSVMGTCWQRHAPDHTGWVASARTRPDNDLRFSRSRPSVAP